LTIRENDVNSPAPHARDSYFTLLGRALRLRCPRCGQKGLFLSWFRMREKCESCGLDCQREPGFYLGSVYVNYGLTAVLTTILFFVGYFAEIADPDTRLIALMAFCVLFPLLFFPFARAIWLAFDQFWDPQQL
jgi:uncharacterized protein (DUF983 family)